MYTVKEFRINRLLSIVLTNCLHWVLSLRFTLAIFHFIIVPFIISKFSLIHLILLVVSTRPSDICISKVMYLKSGSNANERAMNFEWPNKSLPKIHYDVLNWLISLWWMLCFCGFSLSPHSLNFPIRITQNRIFRTTLLMLFVLFFSFFYFIFAYYSSSFYSKECSEFRINSQTHE